MIDVVDLSRKEFVEEEMKKEAQALMKDAEERRGSNVCSKAQGFLWDLFYAAYTRCPAICGPRSRAALMHMGRTPAAWRAAARIR